MSKSFSEANRLALRLIAAGKLCAARQHHKLVRDGYVEVKRNPERGNKQVTVVTKKGQRELSRNPRP